MISNIHWAMNIFSLISIDWFICRCSYTLEFFGLAIAPPPLPSPVPTAMWLNTNTNSMAENLLRVSYTYKVLPFSSGPMTCCSAAVLECYVYKMDNARNITKLYTIKYIIKYRTNKSRCFMLAVNDQLNAPITCFRSMVWPYPGVARPWCWCSEYSALHRLTCHYK